MADVEKVIGGLEILSKNMDNKGNFMSKSVCDEAIQNIRELQSKSDEVCEWEYVDTVSFNAKFSCNGKIRNIKSMRSYKYCPYCGRKIKVVDR